MKNQPNTMEEAIKMIEGYRSEMAIMWAHADEDLAEIRRLRGEVYRLKHPKAPIPASPEQPEHWFPSTDDRFPLSRPRV
jgi:hypothetical protein